MHYLVLFLGFGKIVLNVHMWSLMGGRGVWLRKLLTCLVHGCRWVHRWHRNNKQKHKLFLFKKSNLHALIFLMTKENYFLWKRFLSNFFAWDAVFILLIFFPVVLSIPFCIKKVLSNYKKINWNIKGIWQFFSVHLYVPQCRDFGKKNQNN